MSSPRRPLEESELLELLLERGLEASIEQLTADGRAGQVPELRDLQAFLVDCRSQLAPAAAEPQFVAAVLARTTRRDLSLRGDLALVLRFGREALAGSPLLRAAAALLLLPLLGAPVLAWLVLRSPEPERAFRTRIEAARVEPFLPAVPEGPAGELEFASPGELLGGPLEPQRALIVGVPSPARCEQARRAALEAQRRESLPRLDAGPQASPLALLLDRRADYWNDPRSAAGDLPHAQAELDSLGRALRVEALLDRWAREGRPPAALEAALGDLGRDPGAPLDVRRLEALALDRARSFGRVDAQAWTRLARAGARPGERDPSGVDRRWRASLAAALEQTAEGRSLLAEPELAAWLQRP